MRSSASFILLLALAVGGHCQSCTPPQGSDGRIYTSYASDSQGNVASGNYATMMCPGGPVTGVAASLCWLGQWNPPFGSCSGSSSSSGSGSASGSSSASTTTKKPKMCFVAPVDHAQITVDDNAVVVGDRFGHLPGMSVNMECDAGFVLIGNANAKCRSDALWSQQLGYCATDPNASPATVAAGKATTAAAICYVPQVANGDLLLSRQTSVAQARASKLNIIAPGTQIQLICNDGYQPSGAASTLCKANGHFTNKLGSCVKATTPSSGSGGTGGGSNTVVIWVDNSSTQPGGASTTQAPTTEGTTEATPATDATTTDGGPRTVVLTVDPQNTTPSSDLPPPLMK